MDNLPEGFETIDDTLKRVKRVADEAAERVNQEKRRGWNIRYPLRVDNVYLALGLYGDVSVRVVMRQAADRTGDLTSFLRLYIQERLPEVGAYLDIDFDW